MGKNYTPVASTFYCTQCGKQGIPINRKKGQERKSGHLKKLYCINCKKEINHVEIKQDDLNYTYENFKEEFQLGRFKDGQRIEIKDLLRCEYDECPYNKNNLCWNANNSIACVHKSEEV